MSTPAVIVAFTVNPVLESPAQWTRTGLDGGQLLGRAHDCAVRAGCRTDVVGGRGHGGAVHLLGVRLDGQDGGTADECWAIYDEFRERYRLIPMFGFACGTGQAEAFAVCNDVIDQAQSLLTVRRQVLRIKETRYRPLLVDRLKTSPRLNAKNTPMPPYLLEAVAEYTQRFPPRATKTVLWEHRKKVDDCKRGSARALFWSSRGNLLCRNHFNDDLWKPTMLKLGIKDEEGNLPAFHDLRHTFISTCLQNGIPEHTVAAWVGDSVDEHRRTYSHLLKDHVDTHGAVAAGLTARPKLSIVRNAA